MTIRNLLNMNSLPKSWTPVPVALAMLVGFHQGAVAQPSAEAKPVAKPAVPPPNELTMPPIMWRGLPTAHDRPPSAGGAFFVDGAKGSDSGNGSRAMPWKTIAYAVTNLVPGSTLYIRGGVYFETVKIGVSGEEGKPVTIRAYPGELVVVDNGLPEFEEEPETCWEPARGGVPGEFVSTKSYPELGATGGRRGVNVLARLLSNMVPLQGYKFLTDLRSKNELWLSNDNAGDSWNVYVGPGVWLNPETKKIHLRLSPLTLEQYGDRRIDIGSDPRQIPMVMSRFGNGVTLDKVAHVRLQDLVVRGSMGAAVHVTGCQDIEMDGMTVYAGTQGLKIEGTTGFKLEDSVLRGLSAPWSTRASHKYRGNSPYLLMCGYRNADFEYANCEFTDSHDGLYIGNVPNTKFHNNIVENFDDDGVYLNADASGSPIYIYENRFSRILSNFSYSSAAPLRSGAYIFRNVFDLRQPTLGGPPEKATDKTIFLRLGKLGGDHGDALWQPMFIYQNTALIADAGWRGYYAGGWGWAFRNSKRRVFNNIVVQENELPGLNFDTYGKVAKVEDDFQANNNLLWSLSEGPKFEGDFFAKYRKGPEFQKSAELHQTGWTAGDVFADPKLSTIKSVLPAGLDVRPQAGSPAIDAGLAVPADWPDTMRELDKGKPDIGAFPLGAPLPKYGARFPQVGSR